MAASFFCGRREAPPAQNVKNEVFERAEGALAKKIRILWKKYSFECSESTLLKVSDRTSGISVFQRTLICLAKTSASMTTGQLLGLCASYLAFWKICQRISKRKLCFAKINYNNTKRSIWKRFWQFSTNGNRLTVIQTQTSKRRKSNYWYYPPAVSYPKYIFSFDA